MSLKPKVSIIIPCYNMGEFLQETLNSVISYPRKEDYEIIIVNDGSTDEKTLQLLSQLEKSYNVLHQNNKGLGNARNTGIKRANGEYILPLDADNKIRHNYISESIKILDSDPDIDIVYGNRQKFGEATDCVILHPFSFPKLCAYNYIDACACYRKNIWEKVNGYDENMPVMGYEDWDFWLRTALQGANFYHLNQVTFDYRVRKDSMVDNSIRNYEIVSNYMYAKKELAVVKSIGDFYTAADEVKWIPGSGAYKLGKFLLAPLRLIKKITK